MCGICGVIYDDHSKPVDIEVLKTINRTMTYRGPDDEGYYVGSGAGLAMRRLSIIDVKGGHQPLASEDGDIQTVCNGELYNFKTLRNKLIHEGHVFRTNTDAEILPHLYQRDGIGLVHHLNGMFGLAVWDEKRRILLLARDRMGQKPLYWMRSNNFIIFASELKAILAHPEVNTRLSKKGLSKYLAYEYVPAPGTIFENIHKLKPGYLLRYKDGEITTRRYWDLPIGEEVNMTMNEASERLITLLKTSVNRRLISDVPLGVFLSGGIDSSAIVATMAKLRDPHSIKTFSIAFSEKSFDESSYAKMVASHFGTHHREKVLNPNDLIELLPEVTDLLDEPLGDASIIPTYALSKFTRKYVTVALGGDGGDELFAGYPTFQAEIYSKYYRMIPWPLRKYLIEPLANRLPVSDNNISFDFKIKQFLKGAAISDLVRHMVWMGSFSVDEQRDILVDAPPDGIYEDLLKCEEHSKMSSSGNRLLYAYKKLYLAEDILTKVDRASMWQSLEARAPFLDHELVEFVFRLPYKYKLNRMNMKYILKKAIGPDLPEGIANRPKKGFGMPVAKWIKGPINEMACDLLGRDKIKREGIFKSGYIYKMLEEHLTGRKDNRKKLWTVIIFEKWLEKWGSVA